MPLPFPQSLCHGCAAPVRYVRTATSLFLRCPLLPNKYPPQPVRACPLYRPSEIATERLVLRQLSDEDLPFLAAMSDSVDDAPSWLLRNRERHRRDGHAFWLALSRDDGAPVGQIGLLLQDVNGAREPEVAYHIHAPFRRRGFAVEGARAVLAWAFARGHDHAIALVRDDNLASQGVARRLGMTAGGMAMHGGAPHRVWRVERG